jgi:hypothetical protein
MKRLIKETINQTVLTGSVLQKEKCAGQGQSYRSKADPIHSPFSS